MSVFDPKPIDPDVLANLGPLAPLAGVWEGDQGLDVAPQAAGAEETAYRERLVLAPLSPVANHSQVLYGLRYATTAWPLGEPDPFHEEVGYWLYDPAEREIMRCFAVPRGVTLIAGGRVDDPGARSFQLRAEADGKPYGILNSGFLERAFRTVRYELEVTIEDGCFRYSEDTQLSIDGVPGIFHHTDRNVLTRVGDAA